MEDTGVGMTLSMSTETLTMFVLRGYGMSHSSATDWPRDLGDLTLMLLESIMGQVLSLGSLEAYSDPKGTQYICHLRELFLNL